MMQPDDKPAHDDAEREAEMMLRLYGTQPVEPTYFTLGNIVAIVLGFALALGLALLVMQP